MMTDLKPGLQSTEFTFTALLTAVGGIKTQVGELTNPELYALTAIIISYILSRAWVKAKAATPAPVILEKK